MKLHNEPTAYDLGGKPPLDALCAVLGYTYRDISLLHTALTHSSFSNETEGDCNERLEFLGDSILGFIAAEQLYSRYPEKSEGDLTRIRASYVCEPNLAAAARRLRIGAYLRLGRGEVSSGGADRDSLLSDAFEAILGSLYLDGGVSPCRNMVVQFLLSRPVVQAVQDAKTTLQERVQARGQLSPTYRLVSEIGPEHLKIFCSQAIVEGKAVGIGEGRSKKLSEQAAALDAMEKVYGE